MIRHTFMFAWLLASTGLADERDRSIDTASELRDWCKSESEAALVERGLKPYNWSASYHDEGNVLVAKGQWRIEANTVIVECRIARGARAGLASMSIQ